MTQYLFSPFCRWEKWGLERWSNFFSTKEVMIESGINSKIKYFKPLYSVSQHKVFCKDMVMRKRVKEWLLRFFLKILFNYLFIERGKGREKERERNINVWLPIACPQLGTWTTAQACAALTRNRTGDPLRRSIHWATPAKARFLSLGDRKNVGRGITSWKILFTITTKHITKISSSLWWNQIQNKQILCSRRLLYCS